MSDEEKKAIEKLKEYALCKVNDNGYVEVSANGYKHTILNLIENQQKELNNLKEIEKSHKEENGKLRVKLTKQEKMIEYMVNWINDHEDPFEGCHENEKCGDDYISCEQCIKQYFEKKAEESE